jgi:hypothetical protein
MLKWYADASANYLDASAAIDFTRHFLAASSSERTEVVKSWNPELKWALPNPWRLACTHDGPAPAIDRIRTTVLFQALAIPNIERRDAIAGLAIIWNGCKLAGFDPRAVFEEIATAVGSVGARILQDFANRDAKDQSMEAFRLEAIADPGGGYLIRANR